MSSEKMVASSRTSGTSPLTILRARPSAIAVLPTPGSPTSSGLFFERRHRTWIVRRDFGFAADQRIDLALAGLLVEVDAIVRAHRRSSSPHFPRPLRRRHHALRERSDMPGALGDPVADVLDGIEARHLLLLQEERGVAFALGKDRNEHVGAGHLLAPDDCTWTTAR
jgi:hypothetical protein